MKSVLPTASLWHNAKNACQTQRAPADGITPDRVTELVDASLIQRQHVGKYSKLS